MTFFFLKILLKILIFDFVPRFVFDIGKNRGPLVDTVCPDRGARVNHNTDGLGVYKGDTRRRRRYLRDSTAAAMT